MAYDDDTGTTTTGDAQPNNADGGIPRKLFPEISSCVTYICCLRYIEDLR